jgi:hypothetical protein
VNERIHKLAEDSGMTQYVAADNKYLERLLNKYMDQQQQSKK